ncbi:MAG TPA: response regulator [Candidatus Polarisedimenticolaceae bacterium]|nr:response regulator [Candidatus Polarisedimenticolaceae bacterium]
MGILLELMGHEVRLETTGAAAVEAVASFHPEVVLLDLGLPGMDGYKVARRIRALPNGNGIVLIAQTGWGRDSDRRRSAESGFDHHLVKPVTPEAIEEILRTIDTR